VAEKIEPEPPRPTSEAAMSCGYCHPDGPVGRFLRWTREDRGVRYSFHFEDPYRGFGASTAQFAVAYAAGAERLGLSRDWRSVWRFYRDLMGTEGTAPRCVDLAAQLQGGVTLFNPASLSCADVWDKFDWSRLLVFTPNARPDRKVATRIHLKKFFVVDGKVDQLRIFSRLGAS
jgi:hypothetical protein